MPRKHKLKHDTSLTSSASILLLIIIQVVFILYLVGQSILVQSSNLPQTSDASERFAEYPSKIIKVGTLHYNLYIADTEDSRTLGLSDTLSMFGSEGMMFQFDEAMPYSFWMKDMHFPLDILYLQNEVIVDIFEDVQPESYPDQITPQFPADTVIELKAGQVRLNQVDVGDQINLYE